MTQTITRNTRGVYVISATPFKEDGTIDMGSLDRLTDFFIEKNVTGITILGMMGEADKLTPEESRAVIDRVIARCGNLPVIVGVSGSGLRNLADLSRYAMDKGAAGVMVTPNRGPAYDDRVEGYFHAVAKALPDVPLILQDFPLSTGVPLSARLIRRLSLDIPQLVMLKHEDWPGLTKITAIRDMEKQGDGPRMSILCGNGGLYLPQELARGADGAMTGFAYPEALVRTVELFQQGKQDEAEDFFDAYIPILRHEQQPGFGLAVRKYVLKQRGMIACEETRAPGPRLSVVDRAEVDRLMHRTQLRLEAL